MSQIKGHQEMSQEG